MIECKIFVSKLHDFCKVVASSIDNEIYTLYTNYIGKVEKIVFQKTERRAAK